MGSNLCIGTPDFHTMVIWSAVFKDKNAALIEEGIYRELKSICYISVANRLDRLDICLKRLRLKELSSFLRHLI